MDSLRFLDLWIVYDIWHNTTKNEEYRFLVATYVLKINQDGVIANEQYMQMYCSVEQKLFRIRCTCIILTHNLSKLLNKHLDKSFDKLCVSRYR